MKNKKLLLFIVIVSLIIIITKVFGFGLPVLFIDFIIALFLLFMSKDDVLYSLFFLLPLSPCFDSAAHIWLICLAALFIKKMKCSIGFVLYALIFIGLELIAYLYYGISDLNRMIGYLSAMLIFIFIFTEIKESRIVLDKAIKIYCFSVFLVIVFYLLSSLTNNGDDIVSVLFGGARFGGTTGEEFSNMLISINANTLAYYCVSEIALLLVLMKKKALFDNQKTLFLLMTVFVAIFGILTVSRTFIITFAICIMLFLFSSLKNKKQLAISLVSFLAICVFGIVLINSDIPVINSSIERFQRDDLVSMNGRTDILSYYLTRFSSKSSFILFGSGVTDYGQVYNYPWAIHNGILQVLVCCGIFGFVTFIILLVFPIIKAIKIRRPFYAFIPLIVCIVFLQTIQLLNPYILLFPLAISYLPLISLTNSNKELAIDENN